MQTKETYNDHVVRLFLFASAVWGIIGMLIGMYLAAELAWPFWNFDIPFLTFSKLRPDHTFGVIFAFGGSALMGTCYYTVQRTGHTRLAWGGLERPMRGSQPMSARLPATSAAPVGSIGRSGRAPMLAAIWGAARRQMVATRSCVLISVPVPRSTVLPMASSASARRTKPSATSSA